MKFGIVAFPGSNCDHDAIYATSLLKGSEVFRLWHKDTTIQSDIDCIILPGGFSFGDYLRCGAIARFSPIMNEVIKFAQQGKYVMGICNGFQMLCECGLLPGTLLRNQNLHFVCKDVYLSVENNKTVFTSNMELNDILRIPIAHGDGNYFAEQHTLEQLYENEQIIFKYVEQNGELTSNSNPNGSLDNIAGISNKDKNVLGMMPHPERYSDKILGCDDGIKIFESIMTATVVELFG